MIEEELGARPHQPPLAHLVAPVHVAELQLPNVVVERLDVMACRLRAMKERVLDVVHLEERSAASVQRLEDDLRVIAVLEVDRDDLELLHEHAAQRL